jgi:RNA polymerase sigma-70 factor (ECF subfamily)
MKVSWGERADQDRDLVQALRREEPSAAGLLIERHGARIYRLAGRILDDPRDVEEVTQDVLVTIIREIQTFKGAAAFSSWIYRITANAAFEKSRKSRRARSEVSLDPYLPTFDAEGRHAEPVSDWSREPDDAAMAGELKRAIEHGLRELPAAYRAVVLLRDVEGLPTEEVAGILGVTIPAVKSRVHRARLFLRRTLGPVLS